MSHPSPSGERSSATTPRTLPAASGSNPVSSRPGTAGTTRFEPQGGYPATAPAAPPEEGGRQHEYQKGSPDSAAQTPLRALGVHSILNPQSDARQPSPASAAQPSLGTMSIGQTLLPPPAASPRSRKRPDPASPTRQQEPYQSLARARRVLTPKSPGLRAASLGSRRNPTFHGTGVPLQPIIGPESRIYTAEPGSADIPSLPPLAIATRAPLSTVPATEYPPYSSRQTHASPSHIHGLPPNMSRQGDSPHISQTPHSQQEQQSPAFRYGSTTTQQSSNIYRGMPAGSSSGYSQESHSHGPHEGYQAGPASYHMTLDTDQGPMVVPVELDLQQASRVADEKRKRNAGASARFRARRKEKEKEASQTISGLQQELRELADERDFYRNERNVFRDFAARHVGAAQLPPRPPSPQRRQMSIPSTSSAEGPKGVEDTYRARSESTSTAQRRRTGDYQPNFVHSDQSPSLQAYNSAYSQQPSLPLPPPPLPPPLMGPGQYASPRSLPPGPPVSQPSRSQSYDPFRKDPFDRSWNPGR